MNPILLFPGAGCNFAFLRREYTFSVVIQAENAIGLYPDLNGAPNHLFSGNAPSQWDAVRGAFPGVP